MKLKILTFEQPIGEFALTVMSVKDIIGISHINRREFDQVTLDSRGGPQRERSDNRINEIAKYSETTDATFPTPILLGLPENSYTIENDEIVIQDNSHIASIVDGQHRILGLEKSKFSEDFVLPVVFLLDAIDEQMALIFAIINGKQTRVSGSVIFDLFNVVEGRSPIKTCHEIARALNADENSPFFRRLKMLGKKAKGSNETLSQGTFITYLVRHISTNPTDDFNRSRSGLDPLPRPNAVLNQFFLENKDEVILKVLLNLFKAVSDVFPIEWVDPNNYILSKTTGYTGIMKAFAEVYKIGAAKGDLSYDYFGRVFNSLKQIFDAEQIGFNSNDFPPNNTGESKLRDRIIESAKRV
jgi:DGQHR domain-containing protein